jgi:hypothetical protein
MHMNMRSICLSSCVAIIAASVAFVGAAPQAARTALNVKLGLWEMTTSVQMSGMPAPEPSGKMTPEEKARLDAAMKGAAAAAATPHTTRTCLTREKLDKSLFQDSQQSCKQTMITNTATVNAFKFECTGQPPSTGEFHFEALTPESVKGTGTFTMTGSTRMTSRMTMTAKWIGESCGDVK